MPDMEFMEALRVGLRPDNRTDRNSQRLVTLQGLIPTEWGLKQLVPYTYPFTVSPAEPSGIPIKFARLGNILYMITGDIFYAIDETGSALPTTVTATWGPADFKDPQDESNTGPSGGGDNWQVASFSENCWFVCNDLGSFWMLPSNATAVPYFVSDGTSNDWLFKTCAKHGDRLVLGSFVEGSFGGSSFFTTESAQWLELFNVWRENAPDNINLSEDSAIADNYICYSQQAGGDYDLPFAVMLAMFDKPLPATYDKFKPIIFTLIEQGQMGFFPIQGANNILAMKEHNGDLIVYSDTKVSRLSLGEVSIKGRPGIGYREQVLLNEGIPGSSCIDGNDSEHLFITNQGELYKLRAGEGLQRLGYQEYINSFSNIGNIVITHDEQEGYWWLADGNKGFCLTRTGLGGCDDIAPLALFRTPVEQGLFGAGITAGSPTGAVVETEIFDGKMRQAWEIAYVDISTTDTDATGWQLTPKYRLDKSDAMTQKAAETFDQRGRVRTKTPGIDHAIRLIAANRTLVDLERIHAHAGTGKLSLRDLYDTV